MKSTTFTAVKALISSDSLTPGQADELLPLLGGRAEQDELLTRHQVAAIAKVNPRTVDRMVKENRLPVVRIGNRSPRFKRSAIESAFFNC
jgi:excisionase family DNA binding protein